MSPKEKHDDMKIMLGDDFPPYSTVTIWDAEFKRGRPKDATSVHC